MKLRALAGIVALTSCLTIGVSGIADASSSVPTKKPPCAKAENRIENLTEKAKRHETRAAELRTKAATKEAAGKAAAARALTKSAERAEKNAAKVRDQAAKLAADCGLPVI